MIEIQKIDTRQEEKEQIKRLDAYKEKLQKAAEEEGQRSIPQLLEEIANRFCDKYCKYPNTWDEEKEGCELCDSGVCAECPINQLT